MLIELVAYAKQRGVRIIPEIDVSLSLCCSSGLGWQLLLIRIVHANPGRQCRWV